jgi:hypothetical protein
MYHWTASRVSPLADWPHGYAPWLVDAMTALHSEIAAVDAATMKSITDGR